MADFGEIGNSQVLIENFFGQRCSFNVKSDATLLSHALLIGTKRAINREKFAITAFVTREVIEVLVYDLPYIKEIKRRNPAECNGWIISDAVADVPLVEDLEVANDLLLIQSLTLPSDYTKVKRTT